MFCLRVCPTLFPSVLCIFPPSVFQSVSLNVTPTVTWIFLLGCFQNFDHDMECIARRGEHINSKKEKLLIYKSITNNLRKHIIYCSFPQRVSYVVLVGRIKPTDQIKPLCPSPFSSTLPLSNSIELREPTS